MKPNRRLQAKIGELLMETELLYAKVDQLEAGGPLAPTEVEAMKGAHSISHASGVWRAAGLPGVAVRPLERLRAAAGDDVPDAVPGGAGRSGPPRTTSWSATSRRVLEASPFHGEGYRKAWAKTPGRGDPHRAGTSAPVDAGARPPGPAPRGPGARARRHTTARSPRRPLM